MKIQIHLHLAIGLVLLGLVTWAMFQGLQAAQRAGQADHRAWQEQRYQDCMAKINDSRVCYQDVYARP